ncbi:hypothetical protein STRCI_002395 [Streptomyces cinnabarinus]|uniref:Integral membrane protein n=1 Tax=Streptomyces cinnabarinus TaxID=67287 RepID=A0ABY7KBW4_9ACTN|nr:hypothetical protein [Streptomyces cinnabarinus]WAZ21235.1 hypothetical protein STRCI_002395 [Streptomyces cinnabarinus]
MSGGLWMPAGARSDTLPTIPRQRTPSWAEPDPVDELAARLDDFVAAAVHPDEIAALLESDGLSDDQIRERYGVKNSFALAEVLYDRVPRRYPEPRDPAPDPWRTSLLGCLLRGVVFALPGFGYVLGAPLLAGPRGDFGLPAGTVPLLAAALFGWTWNQGLSHRAYTWLGLADKPAARRTLLLGAPTGALLGTLTALACAGTATPAAVLFAAGQSCYLAAATALLVLSRERALLAALIPLTAGALLALVHPIPETARIVLLAGSLLAVAALALRELVGGTPPARASAPAPTVSTTPGNVALAASLPYALFGLGSGALVVYAALGDVLAGAEPSAMAAPAAVALTLSMGPAEWLLYRFRSGSLAGLRSAGTPRAFRRGTVHRLAGCLAAYLTALAALATATAALWPHTPTLDGVRLAGLLLLGVVIWTGLLLQSFGAVAGAALVCVLAALAQTLALLTHTGAPHTVGVAVYGAAAVAQSALVGVLIGRATTHR